MLFAINALLPFALAVIMFALGLGLTTADFFRIAQKPLAFAVGAFLQMVLLPLIAVAVVIMFSLPPELALGLVILSLCPGGPTSSLYVKIGNGDVALSLSLTAVITFVSVFTIPILAGLAANHFLALGSTRVDVTQLAYTMVMITLLPAMLGMASRYFTPEKALAIEPSVTRLAFLAVAGLVLVSLISNWQAFLASVGILLGACLTIMASTLLAGLLFARIFRLSSASATAISVDTTMQNGAMGIIIGGLVAGQTEALSLISVPSGVYGLTMYFVCLPFVFWRRNQTAYGD